MCEKLTERPYYYAIIPAIVRYDKALHPNAKLLYGEITALLNFRNECDATDLYFSKLYELTEGQVSRLVKQLISRGYLTTEIRQKDGKRLLRLSLNNQTLFPHAEKPKKEKPKPDHSQSEENFQLFWGVYGYKIGLEQARKSFYKLSSSEQKEAIEKTPEWKKCQNPDLSLPYPSTYLNNKRWLDEIKEQKAKSTYPDGYDRTFEAKLNTQQCQDYWKHLRSLGYAAKKDRVGNTLDWIKS
jgi:DNA-binding MarR family transcriptional regulator